MKLFGISWLGKADGGKGHRAQKGEGRARNVARPETTRPNSSHDQKASTDRARRFLRSAPAAAKSTGASIAQHPRRQKTLKNKKRDQFHECFSDHDRLASIELKDFILPPRQTVSGNRGPSVVHFAARQALGFGQRTVSPARSPSTAARSHSTLRRNPCHWPIEDPPPVLDAASFVLAHPLDRFSPARRRVIRSARERTLTIFRPLR